MQTGAFAIVEVPGSWQRWGDRCYQLRTGSRRRLVGYVFGRTGGWPRCKACTSCRCRHAAAVRAWRAGTLSGRKAPLEHATEDGTIGEDLVEACVVADARQVRDA